MLEDDFTWVLRKALRGTDLAPGEVAARSGLQEDEVAAFSNGIFSADTARKLARVLDLNPEAFAGHAEYLPELIFHPAIRRIDLPFGSERVNAWLVRAADCAILFDTGHDPQSCADELQNTKLDTIFITHAHADHIGGIFTLGAEGNVIHGPNISGAVPMKPGDTQVFGPLTVSACDLSGHAVPALGYHIEGLDVPVLVTGDALFAGSMGGCTTPQLYQHALSRLRDVLEPLPDETILLPGHGPATTLGEERKSNPFL